MVRSRRIVLATLAALTALTGAGPAITPAGATNTRPDLPGTAAWQQASYDGRPLPSLSGTSPASVAAYFAGLPTSEQKGLATRYPAVVGNMDGAPPFLRYAANRHEVARSGVWRGVLDLRDRQILALDPRERGLAVEVFGDLATADRVAVLVPGAGADLYHLDEPGGIAAGARAMRAEAERQDPGTRLAVIAWAGYATPVDAGAAAMQGSLARVGAARLQQFLAGLSAYTSAPVGLFCHSYGSVVCGLSDLPRQVDDIAVFGSPGVRHRTASGVSHTARVWAGLAAGDPIRYVPFVRVGDYGHGPSPVSPAFGAKVFATTGARGHGGYLMPGTESLRNLVRIALGHDGAVTTAPHSNPPD